MSRTIALDNIWLRPTPRFAHTEYSLEESNRRNMANFPNQVIPGGYYKSVVSGAIQIFGWDMLLVAAADKVKFARVLERIGAYTLCLRRDLRPLHVPSPKRLATLRIARKVHQLLARLSVHVRIGNEKTPGKPAVPRPI